VWDYVSGTAGRPCPNLVAAPDRLIEVGPYRLPPCVYKFPSSVPAPRNNVAPRPQRVGNVVILDAMARCFSGRNEEVQSVFFEAQYEGADLQRKTRIERNGALMGESGFISIKRD
jgi:hypothetical protein